MVLDLFCGVGTFALHLADGERTILGVESNGDAVDGARRSAELMRAPSWSTHPEFLCLDASQIDPGPLLAERRVKPDEALVIMNPPRRGIGEMLARGLNESGARWVVYSSCQVESLARDLRSMPRFTLRSARLLDMFPHTNHYEVIVLLERDS
jgi:23S rRNA (uracil747-C5)-methyltransferase